ncbi:MAG: betaine--homocysteine S-methyltransferase [Acidimicrobiia bacterium]|nr:MAG: betaine--homocysteine S-methyltransferase [Acidimicrobiia bacterium]
MTTTTRFTQLLATNDVLVADGGMGTLLFERGLEVGGCPELLNVERPDIVAGIHKDYVESGADIILTNTFGGTRARLTHYDLDSRVTELNAAGADLARSVSDGAGRSVAVAGSMGPTGELFVPLGPLDSDRALELFAEQASALADSGVDILWIETMSSLDELDAAFTAASVFDLPVVTTMSFDTHGKTMMGVAPGDLASWAESKDRPPIAVGANCGIGPEDVVAAVQAIVASDSDAVPIAKANCGLPVFVEGELDYPLRPQEMRSYAESAAQSGARIIGACCGSTPRHISAIRSFVTA